MVNRKQFDIVLKNLHKEILLMSSMAEEMLNNSIESLKNKDVKLAKEVIKEDEIVDKKEIEIQDLCIKIIAMQQPVAKDLRLIVAALKIITNLERIADHAVNIAEITLELAEVKYIKPLIDIPRMSELAMKVVKNSIDAYVNEDISQLNIIAHDEDQIDNINKQIYRELLTYMIEDPKNIKQAARFLFVSSYLERIADHGTNIFESVYYLVTGKYEDLVTLQNKKSK